MSNDRIRMELTKDEIKRLHTLVCHVDDPVAQSVYRRLDSAVDAMVDAMVLELTPEQLWALAEAMPESATGYALVEHIYALSNASKHPQLSRLPAGAGFTSLIFLIWVAFLVGTTFVVFFVLR